ncbi:lyase family protein [Rothia sp. AR01]|uniref:Lyase family protein n=1 Tax=Rothia santali TaxID=2949643 RepID=A0A9X2KHH2_9MICC|nr:lyase family protein [Rothia santali]MCP3424779.1 lyase family protein [Rothia santali]
MPFTDLLTPGGQRAHDVVGPAALLDRLVETEAAWIRAQGAAGAIDPGTAAAAADRLGTGRDYDAARLAAAAEGGGNPVIGLVQEMRERVGDAAAGGDPAWRPLVHRGLTSQDVMDTALMGLCARALDRVLGDLLEAGDALAVLAEEHAGTPLLARTLAQPALPTSFGARAGTWLAGLTGGVPRLRRARGGAVLAGRGRRDPRGPRRVGRPDGVGPGSSPSGWGPPGEELGLAGEGLGVWHTRRGPVQRLAEALAEAAQACARIAGDVVLSARAEIAELSEPAARGRAGPPRCRTSAIPCCRC